jgi:tetratricopeptide (TPR) repeat protein
MMNTEPTRVISMCADVPLDLDAIVHKAIDRTIERRYSTARELADDLERWLESRPVEARRPTVFDRARLLYRRHPRLTVGVVVACVSVLTLGSLATWQAVRASRAEHVALNRLAQISAERDRADEQARVAEAVQLFVSNDILALANVQSQADVGMSSNPDIKLIDVLDRASSRVGDGRFKNKPAVEAAIRSTIGNAYIGLGRPARAIEHLKRAAELNQVVLGPHARTTLDCRASLATATDQAGRFAAAIAMFEPLLIDARNVLGEADSLTLTIANNLALSYVHNGQIDRAATLAGDSLVLSTSTLGQTHEVTIRLTYVVAAAETAAGKDQTESQLQRNIELCRKAFGEDYPDTLMAKFDLGLHYSHAGDHRKALGVLEPVVSTALTRLGREHPKTLLFVNDIATVYAANGDDRKAADMLAEVYAIHRQTLGEDHKKTLGTLHNLAAVRINLGDLNEGSKLLRQAYEASTAAFGPNAEGTLLDGSNLAETYRRMGRLDDAWILGSEIVERMNTVLGPTHRYTLSATSMKANVLLDQKYPELAEPSLREGLVRTTAALGEKHVTTKKYARLLALCLDALGRADEAEQLRSQFAK